uniref:Uncharacterized protein n=1 Tax=Oryza sativa subsp. japonica TaxID=39947 RepID=Q5VQC5_ORYSJ|nr:hypothetical protein [Oryza sativa Japonica Group]
MAASRPAHSFDLLARFTGRHNMLQLTGTATSSFPAGGRRLISLDLWPIRTSLAGSESSSETAAPVLSQLMKSDNASTPASGKNTYMVADGRIYRCALQRVDSNDS